MPLRALLRFDGGVLVEREHPLARLTALLDEAAAGSGRLVLLGGEAGIGKTSLVAALAGAAAGRFAVRRGGSDSVGPTAALGPFVDAVPELSDVIEQAADLARRLYLSEKTVGHHVSSVLRKLGEPTRSRAVATALRRRIVAPAPGAGRPLG